MSTQDHTRSHVRSDTASGTRPVQHPLLDLVRSLATMAAQAGPGLPNLVVGVVGPLNAAERELVVCRLPARHQVLHLTKTPEHWTTVICVFGGAGAVGAGSDGTTAHVIRTPLGVIEHCSIGGTTAPK